MRFVAGAIFPGECAPLPLGMSIVPEIEAYDRLGRKASEAKRALLNQDPVRRR